MSVRGEITRLTALLISDRVLLPTLSAVVFVVHLAQFTGSTQLDYYPGVIDLPAVALTGERLECAALKGDERGTSSDPLENLQGVSEAYYLDQRLGQPAMLAPFYSVLGDLGFRVAYALWRVVLLLAVFGLCRELSGSRGAAYLCSIALVFSPLLLGITTLNPNVEAVTLVALALLCAARSAKGPVSKQPDEFGCRRIPSDCVALPRHTPGMTRHRALPAGRFDVLGSIGLFLHGPRARLYAPAAGLFSGMLFGVAHVYMAVLALPGLLVAQTLAAGRGWKPRLAGLGWFAAGAIVPLVVWSALYSSLPTRQPSTLHVCLGDLVLINAAGPDMVGPGPRALPRHGHGPSPAPTKAQAQDDSGEYGSQGGPSPAPELEQPPADPSYAPAAASPSAAAPATIDHRPSFFDPCREERGGWHIHRVGPLTVATWGMLNWPLHDRLVRSGGLPFPFMLFLPLVLLQAFGAVIAAAALVGLVLALVRRRLPALTWGLLLYLLLVGGFLAVQENIGGFKLTFVVWLTLPVAVFAAAGMGSLFSAASAAPARVPWRELGQWCAVLVFLYVACRWTGAAQFPLDERWVHQFGWKGVASRMAEGENAQADAWREKLTRFPWLPSPDLTIGRFSQRLAAADGLLEAEWQRTSHPGHGVAWLVAAAVASVPAGELVILNPYLEAGHTTLADPDRCVARAPALKPDYDRIIHAWVQRILPASGRNRMYLVDSVALPIVQHFNPPKSLSYGFNGPTRTFLLTF